VFSAFGSVPNVVSDEAGVCLGKRSFSAITGTNWTGTVAISGHGQKEKRADGPPSFGHWLLDQLQYELLHLVGLGQSGHAGLLQNRILGQVGDGRRDVGGGDAIFG